MLSEYDVCQKEKKKKNTEHGTHSHTAYNIQPAHLTKKKQNNPGKIKARIKNKKKKKLTFIIKYE